MSSTHATHSVGAFERAVRIVSAIAQIESLQRGIVCFEPKTLGGGEWRSTRNDAAFLACEDDERNQVVVPVPEYYETDDMIVDHEIETRANLAHLRDRARLAVRQAIERNQLVRDYHDAILARYALEAV